MEEDGKTDFVPVFIFCCDLAMVRLRDRLCDRKADAVAAFFLRACRICAVETVKETGWRDIRERVTGVGDLQQCAAALFFECDRYGTAIICIF